MAAMRRGRPATMADLEALPEHVKGEIIDGALYTFPRPSSRHGNVGGLLISDLLPPYQRGRGGPGGWWIIVEPGITVAGSPEVAPDIAGWRRERLVDLPARGPVAVVPDWICEVLSLSTRAYDLGIKRSFYARIGVQFLWYVDLEAHSLTASRLADGSWVEIGTFVEASKVRVAPFAEVELDLAEWWGTPAPPTTKRRPPRKRR